MKQVAVVVAFAGTALANEASPLQKTIQMLDDLRAKVIKEGETTQTEYEEYAEWCETRSKDLTYEIKTGKASVEELKATILDETTKAEELDATIEQLADDIAKADADLTAATEVRNKEHADFTAEETELVETIAMIEKAITVLEKELGGGAAMVQLQGVTNLQQALEVMVKASAIGSGDAKKLAAFAQTKSDDDDSDDDTGAPEAAAYESHSGGIVDTLTGLLDEAKQQLDAARGTEMQQQNAYDQLKQSLEDDMKYATQDKDAATKGLSASAETKATAEGDLEVTSKDLAEDIKALAELHQDCMAKAQDFEAETKSRGEELKALAEARKAITEMSMGADKNTYDFLQVDRIASRTDLANLEAIRYVRDLARKHKDSALAQLASRMATTMRLGARVGNDPFGKIKAMIGDMIEKIEGEMAEADNLKAWCDKEYSETNAKKDEATAEHDKLTTKIDSDSTQSAKLKEEVNTLQQELAELAKTQAEMDTLRSEEKATYEQVQPELEMGLKGVKLALKILNDYYNKADKAHDSGDGGASGIIGMLEVVESDFSKNLAQVEAAEQQAADQYERETKENAVEKKTKEQDVKYKTKEYTALDKRVSEATSDREGVQTELDALNEYLKSLDNQCTYKVETYAEKVARREGEISGLKDALKILDSETAFIQKTSTLRSWKSLRGVKHHA